MPIVTCPIEGFEHVTVTYPDVWKMKHRDMFFIGTEKGEGLSPATKELFGTIALCEKIDGVDLSDIQNLPLHYQQFFRWLIATVYGDYLAAVVVPKNS